VADSSVAVSAPLADFFVRSAANASTRGSFWQLTTPVSTPAAASCGGGGGGGGCPLGVLDELHAASIAAAPNITAKALARIRSPCSTREPLASIG
jgi:hypothetical protein